LSLQARSRAATGGSESGASVAKSGDRHSWLTARGSAREPFGRDFGLSIGFGFGFVASALDRSHGVAGCDRVVDHRSVGVDGAEIRFADSPVAIETRVHRFGHTRP
jgi:hypothetical protein